jgi:heme/copper-type cytochrome/quinol oxidase subunit 2
MESSTTSIGFHVAALPVTQVVPVFFFLVFFVWAVYTAVASYHWLRYSNNTTLALSAITVHLIISAWLAVYTVSGLVH